MFDEAQRRAEHLDSLRAQGQLAGPLHGLPISIKDNFHYKGTEASIGMLSFLGELSKESSPLVQILLKLGAVIYVKTNVPQTMMVSLFFDIVIIGFKYLTRSNRLQILTIMSLGALLTQETLNWALVGRAEAKGL